MKIILLNILLCLSYSLSASNLLPAPCDVDDNSAPNLNVDANTSGCVYTDDGSSDGQIDTPCSNGSYIIHDYTGMGHTDTTSLNGAMFPVGMTTVNWMSIDTSGGGYTINDTDAQTITVSTSADLSGTTFTPSETSCSGVSNGEILITSPPSTILSRWSISPSGGAKEIDGSNVKFTGLDNGSYVITYNDGNCSEMSGSITVADGSGITAGASQGKAVSCHDGNDGEIDATASGSTGSYTYVLKDDQNNTIDTKTGGGSVTFTGLVPDTYTVEVTDNPATGCSDVSGSVTLTNPASEWIGPTISVTDASCSGASDGSIFIDNPPSSSTSHYSITPSPSGVSITGPGPDILISNLPADTYVITWNDGSCTEDSGSITVNNGAGISASISGSTPVSCNNGNDGTITATASGSSGTYTYRLKQGTSTIQTKNNQGGSTLFTGVSPGTYTVEVEDDPTTGCSDQTGSVTLTNPGVFSFSATEGSPACAGEPNGTISISNFNNENFPVLISWDGPGGNDGSQSFSGNGSITELPTGSYDISGEDDNGCTFNVDNVFVSENSALTPTIGGDNTFCFDQSTQNSIFVNENYSSYVWEDNNGGNYSGKSININNPGSTDDTYTVTVTDASNCEGEAQIIVTRNDDIIISYNSGASNDEVTCNGINDGSIFVDVSGGTGGFSYAWSPGGATSQDISGLGPATYTLVVTDSEGCTKTFQSTITEPTSIVPSVSPTPASCFGFSDGSINLSVSGGTPGYTFNWSNGASTEDISGLSAGGYTVTIMDANGCTVTQSATVNEPPLVNAQISLSANVICDGDVLTLTGSGGVSYDWGPDGNTPQITDTPSPPSKTYTVEVTDNDGCMNTATANVIVNTLPNPGIVITENSGTTINDGTLCFGSSVVLTGTGGSSYAWSAGGNNPVTYTPSVGTTTYTVTVTNSNNCKATTFTDIFVNDNPNAVIVPVSQEFIQGSPVTFMSDTETSGPDCDIVECLWNFGNGEISSACVNPPSVTYNNNTEFNVTLTVEDECGCTDVGNFPINVTGANDCRLSFTVNNNESTGCVGQPISVQREGFASVGDCSPLTETFTVSPSGNHIENSGDGTVTFTQAGTYTLSYNISDGCNCSTGTQRTIVIEELPQARFKKAGEVICEGSSLDIELTRDAGSSVVINGLVETIQNDVFTLNNITETTTLEILSVNSLNCENPNPTGQNTFTISVIPEFKIDEVNNVGDPTCNEEQTSFIDTIPTLGGAGEITVLQGMEFIDRVEGGVIFTKELPPTGTYEFTFQRGNICSPISYIIEPFECFCTFEPGEMSLIDQVLCDTEVGEGLFTKGPEFNENVDNLIFVLHNSAGIDQVLGQVIAVSDQPRFEFNDATMVLGAPYFISAVGYKGARDPSELTPAALSFKGEDVCLSVVRGQPVRWYKTPTPQINGPLEVCINQYDVEFSVSNRLDGSDIDFNVDELPDNAIQTFGSDDKAFIHFNDPNTEFYTVKVREILSHTDPAQTIECEGVGELIVATNGERAPDKADIIEWPGSIFVCTADNMIYNWGLIDINNGAVTPQGTGKVFFASVGFEVPAGKILFVDIKEDESSVCVTRNFFNSDGPPGFVLGEGEEFQVDIFPNPNSGDFRLVLKSYDVGKYNIEVFNAVGQRTYQKIVNKEFPRSNNYFDFNGLSSGVYYVKVTSEASNIVLTQKVIVH